MSDLISRQAAIAVANGTDYTGLDVADVEKVTDEVVKGLKQLPSAERVGKWIKGDYWTNGCGMSETYGYYYSCNLCNEEIIGDYDKCRYNYCPNCGARMKGEEE